MVDDERREEIEALADPGVEVPGSLEGCFAVHLSTEVRAAAVEGLGPLQGEPEMLVKVKDVGGSRDMELFIIGAMSTLHVGVVSPTSFADALQLDIGRVEDAFLKAP